VKIREERGRESVKEEIVTEKRGKVQWREDG